MSKKHIFAILVVSTFFSVIASLSFISFFQSSCAEAQCVPLPVPTVTGSACTVTATRGNNKSPSPPSWDYRSCSVSTSNGFCSLSGAGFTDLDESDEFAGCIVDHNGGIWRVGAYSQKDQDVHCRAYCFRW